MTRTLIAGLLALACISIPASAQTVRFDNDGHRIETAGPARAIGQSSRQHRQRVHVGRVLHRRGRHGHTEIAGVGLIRVATAAGIDIQVAPTFAPKIVGFISDLVARGYRPSRVTCFSTARTHVRNSNHFWGGACDFNQHGWGKTDRPMYRVADLARKWGLRDGCTFRDCGHIDMPRSYARSRHAHYAAR